MPVFLSRHRFRIRSNLMRQFLTIRSKYTHITLKNTVSICEPQKSRSRPYTRPMHFFTLMILSRSNSYPWLERTQSWPDKVLHYWFRTMTQKRKQFWRDIQRKKTTGIFVDQICVTSLENFETQTVSAWYWNEEKRWQKTAIMGL